MNTEEQKITGAQNDTDANVQDNPDEVRVPTVTPGTDNGNPGPDDDGGSAQRGADTSHEHPFHEAAENEKDTDANTSQQTEEGTGGADETSNKEAGPKGENL